jgi:hypothetical protein
MSVRISSSICLVIPLKGENPLELTVLITVTSELVCPGALRMVLGESN